MTNYESPHSETIRDVLLAIAIGVGLALALVAWWTI